MVCSERAPHVGSGHRRLVLRSVAVVGRISPECVGPNLWS